MKSRIMNMTSNRFLYLLAFISILFFTIFYLYQEIVFEILLTIIPITVLFVLCLLLLEAYYKFDELLWWTSLDQTKIHQMSFEKFAPEFVKEYWVQMFEEDPLEESLENFLSQIKFSIPDAQMVYIKHENGHDWEFKFNKTKKGWRVISYQVGDPFSKHKSNLFWGPFKMYFKPFFNRVCDHIYCV